MLFLKYMLYSIHGTKKPIIVVNNEPAKAITMLKDGEK